MDAKIRSIKEAFGKYNGNELEYILEVLDSESLSVKRQPFTERLEAAFAECIGTRYAIAHNSGTSTLHTCLAALDVGYGDEVISPAQTVIMNSFVTLFQNAIPVYADVDADTFNIDPKDIERKISAKTKAIIAVHMHGLPADMDAIMALGKKHGIPVIEDSAQCILSTYKGRKVGSIGDMASFSFETKKHLSAGEGGIVTTDNEDYGTQIRRTAFNGYKTLQAGQGLRQILPDEFQDPNYKRHNTLGLNYRMNEITAALALAQLERADELVARRQKVASYFLEALQGCDWIIPQQVPDGYENSYWTFTVRYKGEEKYNLSWKSFYHKYKENGGDGFYGGLSVAYQEPVMIEKPFINRFAPEHREQIRANLNFEAGLCPVAETLQPQMMQFKTNYRDLEQARTQADLLKKTIEQVQGRWHG